MTTQPTDATSNQVWEIRNNLNLQKEPPKNRLVIVLAVIIVSLLLVAGVIFGWYYFYGPCGVSRVEKASAELKDIVKRFTDANDIASSTARISLSGPVANLQEIARDLDKVEVPVCLNNSKTVMSNGMDSVINGYLYFMQDKPSSTVSTSLSNGIQAINIGTDEIIGVYKCAPFCASK